MRLHHGVFGRQQATVPDEAERPDETKQHHPMTHMSTTETKNVKLRGSFCMYRVMMSGMRCSHRCAARRCSCGSRTPSANTIEKDWLKYSTRVSISV